MQFYDYGFNLDIVYVIDCTNGGAILDSIKKDILINADEILSMMDDSNKAVKQVREKFVFFGDFATEKEKAIIQTEFFDYVKDRDEFKKQLDREDIRMHGGDSPENGLEALFVAMNSDWVRIAKGEYGRHIIALFTDALPLKLQERAGCEGYDPEAYPRNNEELQSVWDSSGTQDSTTQLSRKYKRLLLYVPDGSDYYGRSWEDLFCWEQTFCSIGKRHSGKIDVNADNSLSKMMILDYIRDVAD